MEKEIAMTGLGRLRARSDRGSGRRELTQFQMGIGLVVGIAGAIIGTVGFLIVLAIIIGLADGH
ncbi:MAG: hypothetical protein ABSH04_02365 [Acidimicrobiales bacterium]|jgi:hypothetical protein